MYTKIAVPLDGSKTAESVLPHLEVVASGCGTQEIILLSVTEAVTTYSERGRTGYTGSALPPPTSVDRIPLATGKKKQQAERYLARIAKRLRDKGFTVSVEVLLGNPAQEVVNYAQKNNCDLILLSSHGRSGVDRWAHSIGAYGGVADKILRASPVAVLMVKAS